ncbi:MAG: pyrimidine 5'-nucleotidase [Burkholderiales bacterium]
MRARPTWIFDLDNTLHNASPHIFPHINRSMTAYLQRHLRLSEEDAGRLRAHYWRSYGATLLGMMRHHGTDPGHFLRETHAFADLSGMVVFERGLAAMLRRLPGRKLVLSNAPRAYALAVLQLIGVDSHFDAVHCIESTGYQPKPSQGAFRSLLRAHGLIASNCIMVEDSRENLRPAKRLGMKTVWITREPRAPAYVDVKTASVLALPRLLGQLGA